MIRSRMDKLLAVLVFVLTESMCCLSNRYTPKAAGPGTFSFASYYGDRMVLQKEPLQAIIWGYAVRSGYILELSMTPGLKYSTHVVPNPSGRGGIWAVKLPPIKETGPYNITVTYVDGTLHLTDVLFGDVWLCSGQSNMQFTLDMAFNATEELEDSKNYPNIRLFTVALTQSQKPATDLLGIEEKWSIPNKDTVGHKPWSYFSAVCWLYGKYLYKKLNYPIGLISSTWGGTPIEAWSSADALAQCNVKDYSQDERMAHSVLWNAMIHPLVNMTIYGAIWYQGEANAGSPDNYKCLFTAMIGDWRNKFYDGTNQATNQMFPFGFVQLAPYRNDSSIIKGWPDIRWQQTADIGYVPNYILKKVFMAVAMDLPDFKSPYGSVHPRDKQDVAKRLVIGGLAIGYGIETEKYSMPHFTAFYIDIGYFSLRIEYDNSTSILDIRSNDGFEVCCSTNNQSRCDGTDSIWMTAPLIQHDQHSITMSYKGNCSRKYVMGIRYEWRESPCLSKQCAVYNANNGLPAPPVIELGLFGSASNHYV